MMCLGTIIEIEKDLWDMGQAEHLAHFSKSYFCTHIVRIVSDTEICLQSVFCYWTALDTKIQIWKRWKWSIGGCLIPSAACFSLKSRDPSGDTCLIKKNSPLSNPSSIIYVQLLSKVYDT